MAGARSRKYLEGREKVDGVLAALPGRARDGMVRTLNRATQEMAGRARTLAPERTKPSLHVKDDIHTRLEVDADGVVATAYAGTKHETYHAAKATESGRRPGARKFNTPRSRKHKLNSTHPGVREKPWWSVAARSIGRRLRKRVRAAMRRAAKEAGSG